MARAGGTITKRLMMKSRGKEIIVTKATTLDGYDQSQVAQEPIHMQVQK